MTPLYGTDWVSEMLQQMAAESTGTAAPIHLQGEPMKEHNVTRNVTGYGASTTWQNVCTCGWSGPQWRTDIPGVAPVAVLADEAAAHAAQFKAPERDGEPLGCQSKLLTADTDHHCAGSVGHAAPHADRLVSWSDDGSVAPVLAPEQAAAQHVANEHGADAGRHLLAYAAKRAEWLQAKHDADVADKALDVQRAKAIEARRAMRLAEAVADKAAQHRDEQRAIAENLDGELWALVKGEQA